MNRLLTVAFALLIAGSAALAEPPLRYSRDIRPILAEKCFKCHGPDDNTREADLRLDRRDEAIAAGAITPGNGEASELVRRITSDDEHERMPPPASRKELSDEQKARLRRWIDEGAQYETHWAFVKPARPPLPAVNDAAWPQNAVDQFVLARLDAEGLAPSPPADRYTLVRRVFLDLIGLPPTPEEADAFNADSSPDAYGRLVDRLLASPHYGERWARRWLDLARYADTNGYEKDRERSIWPYRDWVVAALNRDLPFDQFTVEQLAGDLLPEATIDQRIATGFHRNTMLNEEGGIDPLEFRYHAMTDRVATTGTAWLGLTIRCAQCHHHKYDPISQREYYQFMAFLNNADEPELDLPDARADEEHRRRLTEAQRLLAELPNQWPIDELQWHTLRPVAIETTSGQQPTSLDDGSLLFPTPGPDRDTYILAASAELAGITQLRIEALADERLPRRGPGRAPNGNFVLGEIEVTATSSGDTETSRPIAIASATADIEQSGFAAAATFDQRQETGWAVDSPAKPLNGDHAMTFTFQDPISLADGRQLRIKLDQNYGGAHTLGRIRLSVGVPAGSRESLAERRVAEVERRFNEWLNRERGRTARWLSLRPTEMKSNLPHLAIEADDSIFVSGDTTKSDTFELTLPTELRGIAAVRIEALPDDRLPAHGPGTTYYEGPKGDFFLSKVTLMADGQAATFAQATASFASNATGAAAAIDDDPQSGWSVAGRPGQRHVAVFAFAEPLGEVRQLQLKLACGRYYASSLGRFRISVTAQPAAVARDLPEEIERLLAVPAEQLTPVQVQQLREAFLLSAAELKQQADQVRKLRAAPAHTTSLVMRERPADNPRPTYVHNRGEFLQTVGKVQPGTPEALHAWPAGEPLGRLGFARWLVSPENPLTARVAVNRQWAALFGRGLVSTPDDFGLQGAAPTHPELLDWLAVEFIERGWSLKALHKLIVTSATYQQSSRVTPGLLAKDPENRLLARAPRLRLDAELIRDSALRASGLLSVKMGGPGVYPPQPAGVTEFAYGKPAWNASQGEDRWRRSIYTFQKRTAPFAMFAAFDAPAGEACVARRDVSDTPLQALTLLNDAMFLEAAQSLARQVMQQPGDTRQRVHLAFRRVLVRPSSAEELSLLVAYFVQQRSRFAGGALAGDGVQPPAALAGDGPGDAAERAAWTALGRALLNLDEAITRN
ncbi:MAG TPA: PSD1 and planctomycete cytochrome C domain-containing protein [Pirellulales bacterium]